MKICFLLFTFITGFIHVLSGQVNNYYDQTSELSWELDFEILIKSENDSNFSYNISQLFHITKLPEDFTSDYIYYPVNLDNDYLNDLRLKNQDTLKNEKTYKTLWQTLHVSLEGGWVHFLNCLTYALETGSLNLKSPLMKRPQTKWKPDPVTESYLRTKKWEYYVPLDQKLALKEYKIRVENNELNDVRSIPKDYLDLFLNTTPKKYSELIDEKKAKEIAEINLVKLILGANYLGEAQITYIRSSTLNAVKNYSLRNLPSIIIFDEYDAAAVMTLDKNGYKIESVAFKKSLNLTGEEIALRKSSMNGIIKKINNYNKLSFQKQLGNYYTQ
jgi:hypothetical protein